MNKVITITPATAATATVDGVAGSAVYASDDDTTSRQKAVTPAAVTAKLAPINTAISTFWGLQSYGDATYTDIDGLTTPGYWSVNFALNYTNGPVGNGWTCFVYRGRAGYIQELTLDNGFAGSPIWRRYFNNPAGTGGWKRIYPVEAQKAVWVPKTNTDLATLGFDYFTTPGLYSTNYVATMAAGETCRPVGNAWIVEVVDNAYNGVAGSFLMQRLTQFDNALTQSIWVRERNGVSATWGQWRMCPITQFNWTRNYSTPAFSDCPTITLDTTNPLLGTQDETRTGQYGCQMPANYLGVAATAYGFVENKSYWTAAVSGIAGYAQQELTIYRSSANPQAKFTRRINRAVTPATGDPWMQTLTVPNATKVYTAVLTETAQTITDQKTFGTNIVIPAQSAPITDATDTTHPATRAEVYNTAQVLAQRVEELEAQVAQLMTLLT
jgi:hypothetical protein